MIINSMLIDYYEILDKYMDKIKEDTQLENKMKEDTQFKNKMKEYFCHHSYKKRFSIDEKFSSYCKFFELDIDYMIKNTIDMEK